MGPEGHAWQRLGMVCLEVRRDLRGAGATRCKPGSIESGCPRVARRLLERPSGVGAFRLPQLERADQPLRQRGIPSRQAVIKIKVSWIMQIRRSSAAIPTTAQPPTFTRCTRRCGRCWPCRVWRCRRPVLLEEVETRDKVERARSSDGYSLASGSRPKARKRAAKRSARNSSWSARARSCIA